MKLQQDKGKTEIKKKTLWKTPRMTGLFFFPQNDQSAAKKKRNIETTFLSVVHTTVERKRTERKVLTFKQLIFHSKYLQTRDRKIIKSDLHKNMYFFYLLHVTYMVFI